ncbi:HlyD family secretion protein [Sphingobium cupriresistens]|jgi:membrane fusion protein (multidrug efflux system)|uniref:Multidrug transporter n=2 Tax=Sphingomonadaceae TaxID=41297 RepID=A0A0J7XHF3_9SPHN|nr:HlyD family secretion protein [Sphingobium cupriresistens]KMS51212.1 multidrug transporter [Sphingobium cupriresistens LL01]
MASLTKRKKTGLLLIAAAVLVALLLWILAAGDEAAETDNAYVRGDVTSLAPKVAGYVVAVEVKDNQAVRAGDILFRIDDRDYRAKLAQAQANVQAARARVASSREDIALQHILVRQAAAQRRAASADLALARKTSDRRLALVDGGAVSQAQVDESNSGHARAAAGVAASEATLDAQRQRVELLGAQHAAALAALAQAEAARDLAQIDLDNTVVRAPIAGVVGNRQVRVGRLVSPGAALLDIVPVADLYVVANFKETQLEYIRPGQAVRIRVDGYPDVAIEGFVDSLAPGSGSAFALIPADNATGNFVRVVQRVPVKIRLRTNPLAGRLVPGLSARVEVLHGRRT